MSIPDFNKSFRDAVFPGSKEPATTFNFVVSVGTRALGDFRSVEGIRYDMPTQKVYEGGRNHSPHILPYSKEAPAGSWGKVTLKWGTPVWSMLYDWMSAVQVGHFFRRDVFILQLNRAGWPTRIMRLHKAFPVAWSAANLDTSTSQPGLESLELMFESFKMVLTRTGSMPSLDDLAATAGRVAGLARDSAASIAEAAVDSFNGTVDLFDGDAYDNMEASFEGGFNDDVDWSEFEADEELETAGPDPFAEDSEIIDSLGMTETDTEGEGEIIDPLAMSETDTEGDGEIIDPLAMSETDTEADPLEDLEDDDDDGHPAD